MPPVRRGAKAAAAAAAADSSDSGAETERAGSPPAPISGAHRRRLSEFAVGGGDGERAPLQAVNMNDDAAEKRRRRKSAKVTAMDDDGDGAPVLSAAPRGLQRLDSVAEVPAIRVPLDVMSSNFEEWMKMATDNVSVLCTGAHTVRTLIAHRKSTQPTRGTLR
jgi:condensin complex subunit 2